MSLNVKALTKVNSQQVWINFNTFLNSSRVNCVIWINFNLNVVHKGWKLPGGGALQLHLYRGVWPQDWKIDPSAD